MSVNSLSEKWLKASVLGTTWAASEIVFGSFLHNLRIPFSGNILTAVGLIILISASYKWPIKGLFWRAGLICAIMKTVSPSAVIFGPMIAIISEAFLLELSVMILGKNILGFLIGSALAMTWVLFQRIINFIIFYGANIIDIYANLMNMAEKQFQIQTDLVWMPIILLVAIHIITGITAGFIGVKAGRNLLKPQSNLQAFQTANHKQKVSANSDNFVFSIYWLWFNLLLLIGSIILFSYANNFVWIITTIIIVLIWAMRYKSSLRHLAKPKFWFFFVFITMLTSFVFASVQPGENNILNGLIVGLQMNFRAAIIIIGFSVVGKELYNPVVISFFQRSSYRQFHLALELSFESVPNVISSLPSVKSFLKNPLSGIRYLIDNAEDQINKLKKESSSFPKIFIISGSVGEGKSLMMQNLNVGFKELGLKTIGFICKRRMQNDKTIGYSIVNVDNNEERILLDLSGNEEMEKIGRFNIHPDGFLFGEKIFESFTFNDDLLFIDEVGKLEISGKGWHESLKKILNHDFKTLILTVRKDFVVDVIRHYQFQNYEVFDIATHSYQVILEKITQNRS
jgi:nucleoside-triphosphatase THEP1